VIKHVIEQLYKYYYVEKTKVKYFGPKINQVVKIMNDMRRLIIGISMLLKVI